MPLAVCIGVHFASIMADSLEYVGIRPQVQSHLTDQLHVYKAITRSIVGGTAPSRVFRHPSSKLSYEAVNKRSPQHEPSGVLSASSGTGGQPLLHLSGVRHVETQGHPKRFRRHEQAMPETGTQSQGREAGRIPLVPCVVVNVVVERPKADRVDERRRGRVRWKAKNKAPV